MAALRCRSSGSGSRGARRGEDRGGGGGAARRAQAVASGLGWGGKDARGFGRRVSSSLICTMTGGAGNSVTVGVGCGRVGNENKRVRELV